jgi:hypothetical protein
MGWSIFFHDFFSFFSDCLSLSPPTPPTTVVSQSVLRDVVAAIPWHSWFEDFQPLTMGRSQEGRNHRGRIIVSHPHGMLTMGVLCGVHLVPGSQTVMCVAPLLFYVPIIG